ncbi:hypothetical protein GCM10020295_50060 [Streptomyces cinereospinus]
MSPGRRKEGRRVGSSRTVVLDGRGFPVPDVVRPAVGTARPVPGTEARKRAGESWDAARPIAATGRVHGRSTGAGADRDAGVPTEPAACGVTTPEYAAGAGARTGRGRRRKPPPAIRGPAARPRRPATPCSPGAWGGTGRLHLARRPPDSARVRRVPSRRGPRTRCRGTGPAPARPAARAGAAGRTGRRRSPSRSRTPGPAGRPLTRDVTAAAALPGRFTDIWRGSTS